MTEKSEQQLKQEAINTERELLEAFNKLAEGKPLECVMGVGMNVLISVAAATGCNTFSADVDWSQPDGSILKAKAEFIVYDKK